MNPDLKQRTTAIEEWLQSTGTSQSALARAADISATVINQVLKGTYGGNLEANLAKIEAAVKHLGDRKEAYFRAPGFVTIGISKEIFNALQEAVSVSVPRILVLYGDSGIGKTETIKQYISQNKNAYLIEIDPVYTVKSILVVIAEALGINSEGSNHALSTAIIKKLRKSGKMLILDEAEYLSPNTLDVIRRIHDKAEIPVALVGMPRLYKNIVSLRRGYEQIANRMVSYNLDKPGHADLLKIVEASIPEVETDVADAFIECSKGTIRTLILLIQDMVNYAHITGEKMTPAMIKKFTASMH